MPSTQWRPELQRSQHWRRWRHLTQTARCPRPPMMPCRSEREMLLHEFAKETLNAQRLNDGYLAALGLILRKLAVAALYGVECRVSQRSADLGKQDSIRTIQGQLFRAGVLGRTTRTQGKGFAGPVFMYSPPNRSRPSLEKVYRWYEGECPSHPLPMNLQPEDIPY